MTGCARKPDPDDPPAGEQPHRQRVMLLPVLLSSRPGQAKPTLTFVHRSALRSHRPSLVGVTEQRRIVAAAVDECTHLRGPPGVTVRLPRLLERIATQIGRREGKRI